MPTVDALSTRGARSNAGLSGPITGEAGGVVLSVTGARVSSPPFEVDLEAIVDTTVFLCDSFWVVVRGADDNVQGTGTLPGSEQAASTIPGNVGLGTCYFTTTIRLSGLNNPHRFYLYDASGPFAWSFDELRNAGFPKEEAEQVSSPVDIVPTEQGRESGEYTPPTAPESLVGNLESTITTAAIGAAAVMGLWTFGPVIRDTLTDNE